MKSFRKKSIASHHAVSEERRVAAPQGAAAPDDLKICVEGKSWT